MTVAAVLLHWLHRPGLMWPQTPIVCGCGPGRGCRLT